MTAAHENQAPVPTEDPNDRLIDIALAELVGQSAPPDLSSRILAAHETAQLAKPQPAAIAANYSRRFKWVSVAVAASLLIGMGVFLTSSHQTQKASLASSSRSAAKNDRLSNQQQESKLLDRGMATHLPAEGSAQSPWGLPHAVEEPTMALAGPPVPSAAPASVPRQEAFPGLTTDLADMPADQSGSSRAEHFYGAQPTGKNVSKTKASATELFSVENKSDTWFNQSTSTSLPEPTSIFRGREFSSEGHARLDALDQSATNRYAYDDRRDDVLREINKPVIVQDGKEISDDVLALIKSPADTGLVRSGDKYTQIVENPFIKAEGVAAVSTFSIDVDTASYSNVRQFLLEGNQLPPPDAVRIEELVNYFNYDYSPPKADDEAPFAAHVEVASCPWEPEHRLARIAVKGREMDRAKRPLSNLVFLVDVSGSMNEPAKLPLVVYGLEQLTKELGENDHIAIVVYAGSEGLALPSTSGTKQKEILAVLGKLQAGGSTAGGAGIQLAYQIAEDNFIKGGTNRVILCTDGDFNVGVTNTGELQMLVEKKAKDTGVFLSVLGFGRGNLNDAMMEAISDHGNGNYHYVDNRTEARRVLVEQMTGTLVTIAKDVKIQVEFNPAKVAGYRLIGYENRMLKTEDFNDDKKDAGEIGAGHTVTALYEIVPAGKSVGVPSVDELKYQKSQTSGGSAEPRPQPPAITSDAKESDELLTLKMRYKAPDGDTSKKLEWAVKDDAKSFSDATDDYQFASAVAGFGLLLRDSQYKGNLKFAAVEELAQGGIGRDEHGYRAEFLKMVEKAQKLKGE